MFLYANWKLHQEMNVDTLERLDKSDLVTIIHNILEQLNALETTLDGFIAGELQVSVSRDIKQEECCSGSICPLTCCR